MSVLSRYTDSAFDAVDWQPDVMAELDDAHLAAWTLDGEQRTQFAASLQQFLGSQPDTDVCTFYGRYITDLDSFCHQLERALPAGQLERRIDGPRGVTESLRGRYSFRMRAIARQRFYVWHDVDHLLRADRGLFGALIDAMMGVSAEAEYVSDDLLMIQRCVFVGGEAMAEYARDPRSQLRCWRPDAFGEPFWRVVTGLEAPLVRVSEVESLIS
jgi:hypothetical protein